MKIILLHIIIFPFLLYGCSNHSHSAPPFSKLKDSIVFEITTDYSSIIREEEHLEYNTFNEAINRLQWFENEFGGVLDVYSVNDGIRSAILEKEFEHGAFQSYRYIEELTEERNIITIQIPYSESLMNEISAASNFSQILRVFIKLCSQQAGYFQIQELDLNHGTFEGKCTGWEFDKGTYNGNSITFLKEKASNLVVESKEFKNDLLHGTTRLFSIGGALNTSIEYNEGKRCGEFVRYFSDGSVFQRYVYPESEKQDRSSETTYWPNGDILASGIYQKGEPYEGNFLVMHHFEDPPLFRRMIEGGGNEYFPKINLEVYSKGVQLEDEDEIVHLDRNKMKLQQGR